MKASKEDIDRILSTPGAGETPLETWEARCCGCGKAMGTFGLQALVVPECDHLLMMVVACEQCGTPAIEAFAAGQGRTVH